MFGAFTHGICHIYAAFVTAHVGVGVNVFADSVRFFVVHPIFAQTLHNVFTHCIVHIFDVSKVQPSTAAHANADFAGACANCFF